MQLRTEIEATVSADVEPGDERVFEANKIVENTACFSEEGPAKPKQTS
jgi:hypothetical protein